MMKKTLTTLWILLIGIALTSCAGVQPNTASGLIASIQYPAESAQLPAGEIVMIKTSVEHTEGAVQAILFVNDAVARVDDLKAPLFKGTMLQGWLPQAAGTYTLKTVFIGAQGVQINSQIVTVNIGDAVASAPDVTAAPDVAPDFAASVTPTITPSPTPTVGPATATNNNADANCRYGPGQGYDIISYFLKGQSSLIVGRSNPAGWWAIERTDGANGHCWVGDNIVTLSGDIDSVPVLIAPATSTPTPSPLFPPVPVSPTGGSMTCVSSVDLIWEKVDHPNGVSHYEYEVERANPKSGEFNLYETGTTVNKGINIGVDCGTDFKWRVRVIDGLGNVSNYTNDMTFTVNTP